MTHVFFTDRDLGIRFPEILSAAGLNVERHCDHFKHNTPDEEWLEVIGQREWIAVTHDHRIRYKPNELAAVIRHGVRLLVVIGKAPLPALAASFVATSPRIETFLRRHRPPMVAKLYRASTSELAKRPDAPGRIELSYPR